MTAKKRGAKQNPCQCPYCNGETKASLPYCQVCGAIIVRCRRCGRVLAQGETACPACGGEPEKPSCEQG